MWFLTSSGCPLDSGPEYKVYRSIRGCTMTSGLTIGQLARMAGVNVQTVRYYERRDLLQPSDRKPSGSGSTTM